MNVLRRKSVQDIRRRRSRSYFTVATIAAAVVGLSMFSLPTLMDRAMVTRIEEDQLHDIRFFVNDVVLDEAELAGLAQIDGVRAMATRTTYGTRAVVGDRYEDVVLIGVRSFDDQQVNVVTIDEGNPPTLDQVITDAQNARTGRLDIGVGDSISLEDGSGGLHPMTVAGIGDTLLFSRIAGTSEPVLYLDQSTVNTLSGARGIDSIEFTVDDPSAVDAITVEVRSALLGFEPDIVFGQLPDVRQAGTWPGEDDFANFATLFYVGAVLALISAMVLISNTMSTMVAEQRAEIAIMKAIGGRRRQITRSFLTTVLLLGLLGAVAGVAVGVPFSNLLVGYIGRRFFGVDPAWGVSMPVVLLSVVIAVGGSVAAAIPALRRAAAATVREGMDSSGGVGGGGALDRGLRSVPLPPNARVGLRNVARRRARSVGTVVQVGLAVGVAVGFLSLGVTVADVTGGVWDAMSWDVLVDKESDADLDDRALSIVESVEGAEVVHPTLYNSLEVDGVRLESWGIPPETPLFEPDILEGRWIEPSDAGENVAVIGRALAATSNVTAGDTLAVSSARGDVELEVVGVDGHLMNDGTTIYLPLATFQSLLGRPGSNTFWVRSESQAEADIDRLAAVLEDELEIAGVPVSTDIHYVEREANLADNRVLVSVLAVMGIPIVAIGMIGLVNLMTMNVIERTREIGILRCIGARARDIRRMFRTEALTLALGGWLLSIPLGWTIGAVLSWVITEIFNFGSVPYTFPFWSIPMALIGTVILAAIVVVAPVRRAARLKPGDALRYE